MFISVFTVSVLFIPPIITPLPFPTPLSRRLSLTLSSSSSLFQWLARVSLSLPFVSLIRLRFVSQLREKKREAATTWVWG